MYWIAVAFLFSLIVFTLLSVVVLIRLVDLAMDALCAWYGGITPKVVGVLLLLFGFSAYLTITTIREVDREEAAKGIPPAHVRLSR